MPCLTCSQPGRLAALCITGHFRSSCSMHANEARQVGGRSSLGHNEDIPPTPRAMRVAAIGSTSGAPGLRKLDRVSVPWFSEAEWLLAREYMEDGGAFHDTYAQFVADVELVERQLRDRGQAAVRVAIVKD